MDFLSDYGLWGLFLSSFLAATLLPLSSEFVLGVLVLAGVSPVSAVCVASLGNVLGALTNYGLGYGVRVGLLTRWFPKLEHDHSRAEALMRKMGIWALCFTWVPVIGDPIALAAGALKIRFLWFIVLVSISKTLRYVLLVSAVLSAS